VRDWVGVLIRIAASLLILYEIHVTVAKLDD